MNEKKCEKCLECQVCYSNQQGKTIDGICESKDEFPVYNLTILTTTLCNLRCKYCYLHNYGNKESLDEDKSDLLLNMTEQTMEDTIDYYLERNPNKNIVIWFFGGEPLYNFKVMKHGVEYTLAKLHKEGKGRTTHFGMTSNLTLITAEINDFLKKYNFGVLCSIDGNKELHDRNRIYPNGKGSWDNAIRGLKLLEQWKNKENLQIRWTAMPQDLGMLVEATRDWFEQGYNNFAIEWVYEEDWTPFLDEYRETIKELNDLIIEYKINKNLEISMKHLNDGLRAIFTEQRPSGNRCGTANGSYGISPKGDIFLCHRYVINYEKEFKVGNVYDGLDVEKCRVINKKWIDEHISNFHYPDKCKNCWLNLVCNGNCLASNYDITGDWSKNPDWVCEMDKIKVEEALHFMFKWRYLFGKDGENYLKKCSGRKY